MLCGNLTDDEFALLARFPKLRRLWIRGTRITDAGLEALAKMPQIEALLLEANSSYRITAEGLRHLKHLQGLREFNLEGGHVSGTGLVHIPNPEKVIELSFHSTPINDDGLRVIAGFAKLETLGLWGTSVTDVGLRHLIPCRELRSIDLYETDVTDEGVRHLIDLPELDHVRLVDTKCTDGCKQSLLRMRKLKDVSFGDNQVSVTTVEELKAKGIDVDHGRLVGFRRKQDFLRYLEVDFEVDSEESALRAYINPERNDVTWELNIECTDEYIPDHMQPAHLEGPPIHSNKEWRELSGAEFQISFDEDEVHPIMPGNPGNIYVGWHAFPNDHLIRFVTRNGSRFLVEWMCAAKETPSDPPEPIEVLAEIPFTELVVWSNDRLTLESAKKLASRHFDLSDFEEPELEQSEFDTRIQFTLRRIGD